MVDPGSPTPTTANHFYRIVLREGISLSLSHSLPSNGFSGVVLFFVRVFVWMVFFGGQQPNNFELISFFIRNLRKD